MENKELAIIEQLPIITDRFAEISEDVKKRTEQAMTLVVTEDNLADIKRVRASLNKEFSNYENLRKEIKNKIMEKYIVFEQDYQDMISNAFKTADNDLKSKINEAESNIKSEKEKELRSYFDELCESKNLTQFINYDSLNIKVNMSDSLKKLINQVNEIVNNIEKDIQLIEMEQEAPTIMGEYLRNGFNFAEAKLTVMKSIREAERLEQIRLARKQQQEIEKEHIEQIEEVIKEPVKIIEEEYKEILTTKFQVSGTREQLIALKEYMSECNLKFENI